MKRIRTSTNAFVWGIALLGLAFRVAVSAPTWLHYDENYYINIAQNYVDRGELTPYMWRLGDANIITGGGSGYGIVVLNEWLRLVGFSLFWGRMLMVGFGLASACIIYFVASQWWQSRKAGLAAFVFAIVATSPFYTLTLRMDAIGILFFCLLLLLHIYAVQADKRWLHFILGVVSVISLEFHILGLLYLGALATYYFVDQLWEIIQQRRLVIQAGALYFGLGVLLAGAIYAAIHIMPDPKAYFLISQDCFECNESLLVTESKRMARLLLLRPFEVVIFFVITLAAATRRKRADIHYLLVAGGWILAQAVVGTPPYTHYTNHAWPVVALGVGGFVAWGFKYQDDRWRIPISSSVSIVLLFFNLGMHLVGFHPYLLAYQLEDSQAVDYIQRTVARDTIIMGKVPSFYPLRDYRNFLAYRDGTEYGAKLRNESMLDFWHRVCPVVIYLAERDVNKDQELITYLEEYRLVQVMPDLWVAPEILDQQALRPLPIAHLGSGNLRLRPFDR